MSGKGSYRVTLAITVEQVSTAWVRILPYTLGTATRVVKGAALFVCECDWCQDGIVTYTCICKGSIEGIVTLSTTQVAELLLAPLDTRLFQKRGLAATGV